MNLSACAHSVAESSNTWEKIWNARRREFYLMQTQQETPDRWRVFYEQVSDIWDEINGFSGRLANELTGFILTRGIAGATDSVLDIGCGPGSLALSLARENISVTALDDSPAMIRTLNSNICRESIRGVTSIVGDWRCMAFDMPHNLVIACFFPDAYCPEGLERMESLAADACLLVMGNGRDHFPFRKRIWEQVMTTPCQSGGFHSVCAKNYLDQSGRKPSTENIAFPVSLDIDVDRVRNYFCQYFRIFGKHGKRLERVISDTLSPYVHSGRVLASATVHLTLLWWKPYRTNFTYLPDNTGNGNR